jgi:hypothetical protein
VEVSGSDERVRSHGAEFACYIVLRSHYVVHSTCFHISDWYRYRRATHVSALGLKKSLQLLRMSLKSPQHVATVMMILYAPTLVRRSR